MWNFNLGQGSKSSQFFGFSDLDLFHLCVLENETQSAKVVRLIDPPPLTLETYVLPSWIQYYNTMLKNLELVNSRTLESII